MQFGYSRDEAYGGDDGGKDRCRMRKVFPIEGNEFEGNLLKAESGLSRSNGELMGSRGPADKVAPGRAGSWKTETGSAGICITKRAINKVLRCRGHRQKSVSSFQARSCNLPLPPVRLLPLLLLLFLHLLLALSEYRRTPPTVQTKSKGRWTGEGGGKGGNRGVAPIMGLGLNKSGFVRNPR